MASWVQQVAATPTRSKHHYYEDARFLYIKVESSVFCVPLVLLVARSAVFADCCSLPQPLNNQEGFSSETPLQLLSVKSEDFKTILEFMFPSSHPQAFSMNQLEVLLRLSDMYDIPTGSEYAIRQLSRVSVPAPRRLAMSINYRVREWFVPAFQKLASCPLEVWQLDDLSEIPEPMLAIIRAVYEKVVQIRQEIVELKPPIYRSLAFCGYCTATPPGACVHHMMQLWNDEAHPMVVSEVWHTAAVIRKKITSAISNSTSICSACRGYYKLHYCMPLQREQRLARVAAIQAMDAHRFDSPTGSDTEEVEQE